ncbi:MAG: OmpP1/FadL family transporter [Flavobacteriales bacterium]
MRKKLLILVCIGSMGIAYAGGFRVALQGIKQAGMGHTGVAVVHDASSVFFNPAGLALIDSKWSVSAGFSGISFNVSYLDPATGRSYQTDNPIGTPVSFYLSHKIGDRWAAGIGVYTPYGSAIKWGKDWPGQAIIRDIELQTIFIQPTLSYKISDWASVGAGFIYALGNLKINQGANQGGTNLGPANLESTIMPTAMGYNVGLMLKPHEKVQVGITYISAMDMEVEGDAKVIYEGNQTNSLTPGQILASDSWKTTLSAPVEFKLGVSYRPTDKWIFAIDVEYFTWSNYKVSSFDFANDNLPDYVSTRNYEDTFVYRVGVSYDFNDRWTGRFGGYYDESPSPSEYFSPEVPTVDILGLGPGFTYKFKSGFSIDGFYAFLSGREKTFSNVETNWTGSVKGRAHVLGVGASYNF